MDNSAVTSHSCIRNINTNLEGSRYLLRKNIRDVRVAVTITITKTSQTDDGAYEVYVENNGNIWDVINIFTENSDSLNFSTSLSDELGRTLPDVDGDGNPDTDTLPKRGSALVLADVTPGEMLPFGTTDTCFFSIVSMRDTTKLDTAFLVTRIREVKIMVDPDTFVTEYPRNTKVIPVAAYSTSLYREDTVNLTYHSTQDSLTWLVSFTDVLGDTLRDEDGNDTMDVVNVPTDSVAAPFQVRVRVPDSALAGDRDTIYLIATSGNYPFGSIYPETIDTTVLIVEVEAVAGLLIVPDTLDSVPSGQTIRYPLEVFNYGNGPDVPAITFKPGQSDWTHRLVDKDGINDLADTDGDDIPDLDTLPGLVGGVPGFDMLYLDVTPPYWALPGLFDSTIVYARSSISDTVYDSAIVVTRTRNIYESIDTLNLRVQFQGTGEACITWHEIFRCEHRIHTEYWDIDTSGIYTSHRDYSRFTTHDHTVWVTVQDEDSTLLATSDTVFVQWE